MDFTFFVKLHEKFSHIQFTEDEHKYTDLKTGKTLISVTTSLNEFKKPFNKEYWLKKKAEEANIPEHILEVNWERKKQRGLTIGNRYHDYIEKRLQRDNPCQKPIPEIEKYLQDYSKDVPVLSEYVVGNDVMGGKFDHLALRGNSLILKDWKTNKKFYVNSKYTMINGLEHLPSSEFYIYALQMSLYRYILEPIPIERAECVWFPPVNLPYKSDWSKSEKGYIVFTMPYLRDEAEYIINHIRKNDNRTTHISDQRIDKEVWRDRKPLF